jgi:hypothetical protein
MKRITIAIAVSAALGCGAAFAQDKAATSKAAAKSTQATTTQAGSTSAGSAAAGQTSAVAAAQGFGNAVITALPHIGIAAGMTAVGSAASDQGSGATTQH